jgi:hypothetical protein
MEAASAIDAAADPAVDPAVEAVVEPSAPDDDPNSPELISGVSLLESLRCW